VYYGLNGEQLDEKPETLTHLKGSQLAEKDNPVIVFRGKLDTLTAMILEAQALGEAKGNPVFIRELQEILTFVRSLLSAEYLETPVREFHILGLSSEELREQSHHPEKYFGFPHLLMDHTGRAH
jgi:ethanolamine utilization cobalamin adenosyltransferase